MKYGLLLFFLFFLHGLAGADQLFTRQRPTLFWDYKELAESGRQLSHNDSLQILTMMNPHQDTAVSGTYNLGVFSVAAKGLLFAKPVALKFSNGEVVDYGPPFKKKGKLQEYVAVHKVLGDLFVSPRIHALLEHDAVDVLLAHPDFQSALYTRHGETVAEQVASSPWIGVVMDLVNDPHPLSRDVATPPIFKRWCESHVRRALDEMVEIRRRVMMAGIFLNDQQLVIDADAHVHVIDVDAYSFDETYAARTSFTDEARILLERWEQASGRGFDPELKENYFRRLQAEHPVALPPDQFPPLADWRDYSAIDCGSRPNQCSDSLKGF